MHNSRNLANFACLLALLLKMLVSYLLLGVLVSVRAVLIFSVSSSTQIMWDRWGYRRLPISYLASLVGLVALIWICSCALPHISLHCMPRACTVLLLYDASLAFSLLALRGRVARSFHMGLGFLCAGYMLTSASKCVASSLAGVSTHRKQTQLGNLCLTRVSCFVVLLGGSTFIYQSAHNVDCSAALSQGGFTLITHLLSNTCLDRFMIHFKFSCGLAAFLIVCLPTYRRVCYRHGRTARSLLVLSIACSLILAGCSVDRLHSFFFLLAIASYAICSTVGSFARKYSLHLCESCLHISTLLACSSGISNTTRHQKSHCFDCSPLLKKRLNHRSRYRIRRHTVGNPSPHKHPTPSNKDNLGTAPCSELQAPLPSSVELGPANHNMNQFDCNLLPASALSSYACSSSSCVYKAANTSLKIL